LLLESRHSGYDIVGDVHGCADALKALLLKLNYHEEDGVYRYQSSSTDDKRQLIFLGDLIDRGPKVLECLQIAKAMVDAGEANIVIGNHEFNALAYYTKLSEGGFLRAHTPRSEKQLKASLDAFKGQEELWQQYLAWFRQLPLFLEYPAFRVVHACWDHTRIHAYFNHFNTHRLCEQAIADCADHSSIGAQAIERLTRGLSLKLPEGMTISGRDGYSRASFRVRFWAEHYEKYDDIVFQPDPLPESIRFRELDSHERGRLIHYPASEKPLFVGHYWLRGKPQLVANNIACLDYSAVNQGQLVAYRFDPSSPELDARNFVAVNLVDS